MGRKMIAEEEMDIEKPQDNQATTKRTKTTKKTAKIKKISGSKLHHRVKNTINGEKRSTSLKSLAKKARLIAVSKP